MKTNYTWTSAAWEKAGKFKRVRKKLESLVTLHLEETIRNALHSLNISESNSSSEPKKELVKKVVAEVMVSVSAEVTHYSLRAECVNDIERRNKRNRTLDILRKRVSRLANKMLSWAIVGVSSRKRNFQQYMDEQAERGEGTVLGGKRKMTKRLYYAQFLSEEEELAVAQSLREEALVGGKKKTKKKKGKKMSRSEQEQDEHKAAYMERTKIDPTKLVVFEDATDEEVTNLRQQMEERHHNYWDECRPRDSMKFNLFKQKPLAEQRFSKCKLPDGVDAKQDKLNPGNRELTDEEKKYLEVMDKTKAGNFPRVQIVDLGEPLGDSLHATARIPKHTILCEYIGRVIFEKLLNDIDEFGGDCYLTAIKLLLKWHDLVIDPCTYEIEEKEKEKEKEAEEGDGKEDEEWPMDPETGGGIAHFALSVSPEGKDYENVNCRLEGKVLPVRDPDTDQVNYEVHYFLVTTKTIEVGRPILWYYGDDFFTMFKLVHGEETPIYTAKQIYEKTQEKFPELKIELVKQNKRKA